MRKNYFKYKDISVKRQIKKLYHISIEEYKEITKKCETCGFSLLVDCHSISGKHLGKEDYIGLCPNCHALFHKKGYTIERLKELSLLKE